LRRGHHLAVGGDGPRHRLGLALGLAVVAQAIRIDVGPRLLGTLVRHRNRGGRHGHHDRRAGIDRIAQGGKNANGRRNRCCKRNGGHRPDQFVHDTPLFSGPLQRTLDGLSQPEAIGSVIGNTIYAFGLVLKNEDLLIENVKILPI
jgi:hypothetical protein